MKKKNKGWLCHCDYECGTWGGLLAHIQREHPKNGYWAWDINHDVGNEFANSALREQRDKLREGHEDYTKLKAKADAYETLLERFNALARAVQIGTSAIEAFREFHEKKRSD